jgi:hypothetical protein
MLSSRVLFGRGEPCTANVDDGERGSDAELLRHSILQYSLAWLDVLGSVLQFVERRMQGAILG